MGFGLTICRFLSGKLGSRELSWFIFTYYYYIKVFGTVGRGFKSLLFSVIVNEPLTEIHMSKLFRAVQ